MTEREGHQVRTPRAVRWGVRIGLGVLCLVAIALAFWACTLSSLGDDARDKAETAARDAAHTLSTEFSYAMTDDDIAERAKRLSSSVVDIQHGQGQTVVTVLVRGVASSVPGPVSAELCYEYVLPESTGEDVRYQEIPECPPVGSGNR